MPKQPRHEFSARTKREAWQRANGYCEGQTYDIVIDRIARCNAPLTVDGGGHAPPIILPHHFDHIDPDWFSKDNQLENCQVLCPQCHKAKTKIDVKNIAKSKRIIDKRMGIKKKKGFRGWRKFDGTIVYKK